MTAVLLGVADQSLVTSLRATLSGIEGTQIVHVAGSTAELVASLVRLEPDVAFVHDQLGPEPVGQVIQDLGVRRPACAVLLLTADRSPEVFARAMDVGARGVLVLPYSYEDVRARLAGAADWALQMQRLLGGSTFADADVVGQARVVTLVGAKGGVGTTTIATHLALDCVRSLPGYKVCLVDLDLEKGDVTGVIDVRHRVSLADLAKVAADLSPHTVADAVVRHESGLELLLTPGDVRDVEAITPAAFRQVFSVLRQEYDLLMVDGGAHVTAMQATVVELSHEVVAVATPDLLCIRSLRRALASWEALGVRREADVKVLLNRMTRADLVQADTVRRLVQAPLLTVSLPAMYRRLEPAINSRDPLVVREQAWWRGLRAIGGELGIGRSQPDPDGAASPPMTPAGSGRRRTRGRSDDGSVSVETVGLLPIVVAISLVCWQMVLVALTFVWSGHAADAATRALSIGDDPGPAARQALPGGLADELTVSPERAGLTDQVTVTLATPLVAPGLVSLPLRVTSTRTVVVEP